LYLYFVFALYERKNEIQKKIKYRSAEGKIADCVSPVINDCRLACAYSPIYNLQSAIKRAAPIGTIARP
jgi:hypothetical protein